MVSDNDDLIGDRSIDDPNDVPVGRDDVILLVVQVQDDVLGRRSDVVLDALVLEASSSGPVLVEIGSLGTVAIQGFQDGKGILV